MTRSPRRSPGTARPDTSELLVVAPTRLEAWAARRMLPRQTPVVRSGVGSSRLAGSTSASGGPTGGTVIVCGLAGSLAEELPAGTVLVPERVFSSSGDSVACDPALQQAFMRAARQLGWQASSAPIVTLPTMITGGDRQAWRQRGFKAVDMESALVAPATGRLAVVRVVLDSPEHDISGEWLRPLSIVTRPGLWPQAAWLAWNAPRYALRAARVVARGLALLGPSTGSAARD